MEGPKLDSPKPVNPMDYKLTPPATREKMCCIGSIVEWARDDKADRKNFLYVGLTNAVIIIVTALATILTGGIAFLILRHEWNAQGKELEKQAAFQKTAKIATKEHNRVLTVVNHRADAQRAHAVHGLQHQIQGLQGQVQALTDQLRDARAAAPDAGLPARITQLTNDLETARTNLQAAQRELEAVKQNRTQIQNELQTSRQQHQNIQTALKTTTDELTNSKNQVRQAQTELAAVTRQGQDLQTALEQAVVDKVEADKKIAARDKSIRELQEHLKQAIAAKQQEIDALKHDLESDDSQQEVLALRSAINEREQAIVQLQHRLQEVNEHVKNNFIPKGTLGGLFNKESLEALAGKGKDINAMSAAELIEQARTTFIDKRAFTDIIRASGNKGDLGIVPANQAVGIVLEQFDKLKAERDELILKLATGDNSAAQAHTAKLTEQLQLAHEQVRHHENSMRELQQQLKAATAKASAPADDSAVKALQAQLTALQSESSEAQLKARMDLQKQTEATVNNAKELAKAREALENLQRQLAEARKPQQPAVMQEAPLSPVAQSVPVAPQAPDAPDAPSAPSFVAPAPRNVRSSTPVGPNVRPSTPVGTSSSTKTNGTGPVLGGDPNELKHAIAASAQRRALPSSVPNSPSAAVALLNNGINPHSATGFTAAIQSSSSVGAMASPLSRPALPKRAAPPSPKTVVTPQAAQPSPKTVVPPQAAQPESAVVSGSAIVDENKAKPETDNQPKTDNQSGSKKKRSGRKR